MASSVVSFMPTSSSVVSRVLDGSKRGLKRKSPEDTLGEITIGDVRKAVSIIRGKSRAQKNCSLLTAAALFFLRTGIMPVDREYGRQPKWYFHLVSSKPDGAIERSFQMLLKTPFCEKAGIIKDELFEPLQLTSSAELERKLLEDTEERGCGFVIFFGNQDESSHIISYYVYKKKVLFIDSQQKKDYQIFRNINAYLDRCKTLDKDHVLYYVLNSTVSCSHVSERASQTTLSFF